ncbi:MAG: hypothetical protein GF416_09475 [Candidatus Altiarchaeales archaeon]|nr:hypothetical protein [Candidatus Altiarchaeales archaeon]MBD3417349.1 hypothetical protein [Candidatus Altiarchaeales archaeon]
MEFEFLEKKKGVVEVKFDEKEVAVALSKLLQDSGVDAYWYEPHPLYKDVRLHVEGDDAMADLKKAVTGLDKTWKQFSKELSAKLK